MFHELLFQVTGAANWLPGFYYLWGGMNDSRVKWFLSAVDYETLSDGRYLSKRLKPELVVSSDKFILVAKFPRASMMYAGLTGGII